MIKIYLILLFPLGLYAQSEYEIRDKLIKIKKAYYDDRLSYRLSLFSRIAEVDELVSTLEQKYPNSPLLSKYRPFLKLIESELRYIDEGKKMQEQIDSLKKKNAKKNPTN